MMKRTKIKIFTIVSATVILIGVGIALLGGNDDNNKKQEVVINEELIVENPIMVPEEIKEAMESGNIELGESILDSNIVSATEEQADEMVYYFMKETETYGNMLINNNPEFVRYLSERKIKVQNLEKFISKSDTPDFIKIAWKDMEHNMVLMETGVTEEYINERNMTRIVPNYKAILDKYGDFISERMKDLLHTRSQISWNYMKTYSGGFDPAIVERNLTALHKYLEKYSEGPYLRDAKSDYEFLLQVYFSYVPGSRLFNEYDLTILNEGVSMYESAAKREDFLGEKAKKMVEGLKQNDNKMTPALLELIEELAEVNGTNYFTYWNDLLSIEVRFEGEGRYGIEEPTVEYITDPETNEILEIKRNN